MLSEERLKEIATAGTNCFKTSVPAEGEQIASELLAARTALEEARKALEIANGGMGKCPLYESALARIRAVQEGKAQEGKL